MKTIGGYFELELNKKEEYHKNAIRLNTGRNAFEYILLVNSYSKIYLPFFTCDVLLEPLNKHKIAYEFYNIDEQFEPLFDYDRIKFNEGFLYTNYFGLKDSFVIEIAKFCKNLIIDSAQAFFSKSIAEIDTFYTARKFFGVPDGAYLYSNKKIKIALEEDNSYDRCSHLLKRLDNKVQIGYEDFNINEADFKNQDIKKMSILTQSLLTAVDYKFCAERRRRNFAFLHEKLKNSNKLKIDFTTEIPMVYPYWNDDENLREKLIDNKIYTALYWPNVQQWVKKDSLEYSMTKKIVYLPIDQRYDQTDIERIIDLL